jgi:lysine 2,3-aminomutase
MRERILRQAEELAAASLIAPESKGSITEVVKRFSLAITPAMVDLIDRNDPADPIARQFIPDLAELTIAPEEFSDPIDDFPNSPVKGLVHRYPDRVLLKPTHACAVYCRFCFRREQVGQNGDMLTDAELAAALDYIRAHPEIWEVIVSGGDPWILSPRRIENLVKALEEIPHVAVIRFHTRVPIADPDRVDDALLAALKSEKPIWVVVHVNHPRELTPAARRACTNLRHAGISLLSQSVLLAGINDNAETLASLFRCLVALGVKPYYLHHGDMAPGTAHFRTTIGAGQEIVRQLRGRVSGLCQPSYVLDIPHAHGKVPVGYNYAVPIGDTARWQIEDIAGHKHNY